jgi:hypothetical protein
MSKINHRYFLINLLLLIVFGFCAIGAVIGQNNSDDKPDPKVEEAQRKQAIAEANKATAEAQRDTYKAIVGELNTDNLPKGTVSVDKTEIESKILAYRSANETATKISETISTLNPKPEKIVILTNKEINNVAAYNAFKSQVNLLNNRINLLKNLPPLLSDNLQKPCKAPQKFPVPPLLAAETALQVLALFKKDTSFAGTEVTLDDFAVYTMILSKLNEKGIKQVIYPPMFYPNLFVDPDTQPQIYKTFETLSQSQFSLEEKLNEISEKKEKLAELTKAETDDNCKKSYASDLATISQRETQIKDVQTFLAQIITALTKPDEQTGLSLLHQYATAERLTNDFKSAHLLQVKPIAAGGTARVKTTIFGSRLSFGGGAILSYMLTDGDGKFIKAGTVPHYGGYIRAKDINEVLK